MTEECTVCLNSEGMDEGQACFVVTTASATYYYQKEGCGFSSLVDRDGHDWINYHPEKGPQGSYRGIPNMGFGVFGHPGFELGAKSWVSEQRPDFVRITSESADRTWLVHWDFDAEHASMTAEKIGARAWLLYEGTPGGRFCPEQQYWFTSDGHQRYCHERFQGRLPSPKWVAFCDPPSARSLLLLYEGPDTNKDIYWPMGGEGGMTVLGLGRSERRQFNLILEKGPWRLGRSKRWKRKMLLSQTPFRFSFALRETLKYEDLKAASASFVCGASCSRECTSNPCDGTNPAESGV